MLETDASSAAVPDREKDFDRFYETELLPVLEQLERSRLRWLRALAVAPLILAVAFGAVGALFQAGMISVLLAGGGFLAGGIIVRSAFQISDLRDRFKREIVGRIARFARPELSFDHQGSISREDFDAGRMFGIYNKFSGEDFFSGRLGKTHVRFSELRVQIGGDDASDSVVFNGVYMIADFNKEFDGLTLVLPDLAEAALGWAGKRIQEMNPFRPGQLVSLEDPDFERRFVVYSTDQVTARYILTPSLMARITALDRRCNRRFSLSFLNSKMHAAFEIEEDMFEPDISSSLLEMWRYRDFYENINFFTGVVDELNLNLRIWSKE